MTRGWMAFVVLFDYFLTTNGEFSIEALPLLSDQNSLVDHENREFDHKVTWTESSHGKSNLLDREDYLHERCNELGRNRTLEDFKSPRNFHNIIVDEQHELLYCYVPKVACTNWKRVLMILNRQWSSYYPVEIPAGLAHDSNVLKHLSNFTLPEIYKMIKFYKKLIVVRHPLERLLSAYRNKFEARKPSAKYFQARFGRKIIRKYRYRPKRSSLRYGNDVKFGEFVDFVTGNNEKGTQNEHWRPISQLCHPCEINYNFISKYETLNEDALEILEHLDEKLIMFPDRPNGSAPTSSKLDKYYSKLSFRQLKNLEKHYHEDLFLFDYSLANILGFTLA